VLSSDAHDRDRVSCASSLCQILMQVHAYFCIQETFSTKKSVNNSDIDDTIAVLAIIVALLNRKNTHSAYHAALQEFVYCITD